MYKDKTLVFIPTYNERENVERLCSELQALGLELDILFMDDNSPDGTGELLEELSHKNKNVFVVHRSGKLGVGSAHFDGIQWAYDQGYRHLVTMDCDFTHNPQCIKDILTIDADVVVGSRYKLENSLAGWNMYRKFLTTFGHYLTTTLLHMPYDATGGFRYYRLDRVPKRIFDLVGSKGYSFFFESLYIIHVNKFKIGEIPIVLPARMYGHSKMTSDEIGRSVKLLFTIYMRQLFRAGQFLLDGVKN